MYTQVANTSFSYLLTVQEIKDRFPSNDITSYPRLITITLVANAGRELDIQAFRSNMKPIKICIEGASDGYEWDIKETQFFNQVTLTYKDKLSNKSIKLFSNGSIQVAGCTDLFDCNRIIKQIVLIIKEILDVEVSIDTFRICMINANFQFNRDVNLRECAKHFNSHSMFKTTFSEDKYAAVKIKFKPAEDMKQMTASIFSTGKVILSGAQTLKEIALGYSTIVQYAHMHQRMLEDVQDDKKFMRSFLGFEMDEWVEQLKTRNFKSWEFTEVNNPVNFLK